MYTEKQTRYDQPHILQWTQLEFKWPKITIARTEQLVCCSGHVVVITYEKWIKNDETISRCYGVNIHALSKKKHVGDCLG